MKIELVPDLIALGMTEREAKLYIAMMEKPEWKSGELHRQTGVPRAQTHQTLELMVSRHYCTKRSEGRFNYYRAIAPDALHEILTRRWNEEVELRQSRARSTLDILGTVFHEAVKGDRTLDFIEIVQTPHRIHQRFVELMNQAKTGIVGFSRSPYSFMIDNTSVKRRDEQTNANVAGRKKGLKNKMLIMYEEDVWPFLVDSLTHNSREEIEEIRVSDSLPVKMFVFDDATTMLAINSISGEHLSSMSQIIIYDRGFATLCRDVFELYWSRAVPFERWKVPTA